MYEVYKVILLWVFMKKKDSRVKKMNLKKFPQLRITLIVSLLIFLTYGYFGIKAGRVALFSVDFFFTMCLFTLFFVIPIIVSVFVDLIFKFLIKKDYEALAWIQRIIFGILEIWYFLFFIFYYGRYIVCAFILVL